MKFEEYQQSELGVQAGEIVWAIRLAKKRVDASKYDREVREDLSKRLAALIDQIAPQSTKGAVSMRLVCNRCGKSASRTMEVLSKEGEVLTVHMQRECFREGDTINKMAIAQARKKKEVAAPSEDEPVAAVQQAEAIAKKAAKA